LITFAADRTQALNDQAKHNKPMLSIPWRYALFMKGFISNF
jgi:hypothetical protein